MTIIDCIEWVRKFFKIVLNQNCRVISVVREEHYWKAVCEVLVDPEYTTRKGIGDIVEIYEIHVTDKQEVNSFELISTRKRATVDND